MQIPMLNFQKKISNSWSSKHTCIQIRVGIVIINKEQIKVSPTDGKKLLCVGGYVVMIRHNISVQFPALFLSCLISVLFLDFGFLPHILLIPPSFLHYSLLISASFFWGFCAAYSAYSLLISALFLPYLWILPF